MNRPRQNNWLLFVLVIVLAIVLFTWARSAQAQEATDVPGDPTDTVADLLPAETDSAEVPPSDRINLAGLAILGGISAAVAKIMELLKSSVLHSFKPRLDEDAYALLLQTVAFAISAFLIFAAPPEINLFSLTGLYPEINIVLAKILTALAVSFGNMVLDQVINFLSTPVRSQTTIQANTPGSVNVSNRV